jgi:hypothetical protein
MGLAVYLTVCISLQLLAMILLSATHANHGFGDAMELIRQNNSQCVCQKKDIDDFFAII